MSSRETILSQLRATPIARASARPPQTRDAELFADAGLEDAPESRSAMVDLFAERFTKLNGELHRVQNKSEVPAILTGILDSAGPGPSVVHADPWLDTVLGASPQLRRHFQGASTDAPSETFAEFAAGVSTANALVARTGSLILTTTRTGGRRLSVFPPLYVAVAPGSRVLPSLDAALARIAAREDDGWSSLSIVTGPSCTADIEKILVRGAHGPKRIAVILLESE